MGFIPDIEEICSKLPASRQTLLFSATMPPPIQKLASRFLSDPKRIEVARPATANINIDQRLVEVKPDSKRETLRKLLRDLDVKTAIIFCNRKSTVRELTTSLRRAHFAAGQIQGDMDQADRIAEFDRFKRGEINFLVASDVAARGLDVKDVSHVFNFDVPWQPDDYIHRIGRTGRAGATGMAVTLATRAEADQVAAIGKLLGHPIPKLDSKAAHDEKAKPEPAKNDERKPKAKAAEPKRGEQKRAEPKRSEPTGQEPKRKQEKEFADADSGWNGPLPSFLSVSAS
jgi:superfamily II DNA/RNA helicase